MPRAGLTRQAVVELALAVVDDGGPHGFEALTLAAVAARAGVAVPSLYKHVAGLPDLRRAVVLACVAGMTEAVESPAAGLAGPPATRAMADAIRAFAHASPGRYLAAQLPTWADDPEAGEIRAAAAHSIEVIASSLRGLGIPAGREIDAIRALRAALHGFILFELTGGFRMADDVDESYRYLVTTLVAGLSRS
ncbi:TetR/AcrR family transcriptional regulator [Pengzhenrongella sicca]|uniref:WHG domain-containing protein n=1 Tax=Pengzhenrongella sicca TaxID=2819238 RepID=A0A8A4ZAH7_9MICO|nr:TetR-like C-terminal domain-containing protein [Pengzhenrongella sicca]QTE28864.1 WHG domain-containing protein [Pengzhenrongella sicca]